MKTETTYESFEELAGAMTDGEGTLHSRNCALNKHYEDPCFAWQKGVNDFAGWLDHIGAKVNITDIAEDFYRYVGRQSEEARVRQEEYRRKNDEEARTRQEKFCRKEDAQ